MVLDQKTYTISDRIAKLKEKVRSVKPSVCTERAKIYTEAYRQHECKPVIVKRALALEKALNEMSIFIDEGELIVGNHSSQLRAAPIFPEYAVAWIKKELDEFDKRPGDAFFLSDQHKEDLKEICSWWEGKTLIEKGYALMSDSVKEIHETGIIRAEGKPHLRGCAYRG